MADPKTVINATEPPPGEVLEVMRSTFEVEWKEADPSAVYRCRRCPKRWSVFCDPQDGTIDRGSYNSLYAHARAHQPGGVKMRRL